MLTSSNCAMSDGILLWGNICNVNKSFSFYHYRCLDVYTYIEEAVHPANVLRIITIISGEEKYCVQTKSI